MVPSRHGMDAETQQHIFEPFFTTKHLGKGTGLGLSSVYGAIVQSGGHIAVMSQPGKGASFSIYLPRVAPAVAVEASATRSHGSKGSETILLVEDETAVRRMLREALIRAGYKVWEAANGAEALAQTSAESDRVDLLVTDILMPVMNGLRLAEELRNRHPRLKVVFMSGHSEEVISHQSGPDPAPDLLQKPFLPEVLVRKVRSVLDQSDRANCGRIKQNNYAAAKKIN
jgi:two-component system, cell cycle sensor histidine kinase and response regulator CckA